MSITYVTGGNAAFFNTILSCLHSFDVRFPGERLLIADYGFTPAQQRFLDGLGLRLPRPPQVAVEANPLVCKGALLHYVEQAGHEVSAAQPLAWIDGDLVFMDAAPGIFEGVVAELAKREVSLAASRIGTVGKLIRECAHLTNNAAPFARELAAGKVPPDAPYFSSGLFVCRSRELLARWHDITSSIEPHMLFEQNAFNVAIHRGPHAVLGLDVDSWQVQADGLKRVQLGRRGGLPVAAIDGKPVRTLHATSPGVGDILLPRGRLQAGDVALDGCYKFFGAEHLREQQLQPLAAFLRRHAEALVETGVCQRLPEAIPGFRFQETGPRQDA